MILSGVLEWIQSAQAIIAASGALLAAVAAWATKAIRRWHEIVRIAKRERIVNRAHVTAHRARMALAKFVRVSGAKRGLLLTARNCGWQDPSRPVSVSITEEDLADDSIPRVFERFQEWRADSAYKEILHKLFASKEDDSGILLLTETMRSGVIRDYYQETGIGASIVFFVRLTGSDSMLYVSLNYGCLHDECGRSDQCEMDQQVQAAKDFFASPERIRRQAIQMRSIWKDT